MHLFTFKIVAYLLATNQLAEVCAGPTHENAVTASVYKYDDLNNRAPKKDPYPLAVPLTWAASDTWQGSKGMSGLFNRPLSDQEVRDAAKQTYVVHEKKQKYGVYTLILSVISVPGAGLAAGSIWHGVNADFERSAQQTAPNFWAAVPGHQQGVIKDFEASKWHAEAVAARNAEAAFGSHMVAGRWPAGTKIYTYGRADRIERPKPICKPGSTTALIPCSQWLGRLNIGIVAIAGGSGSKQ